MRWSVTLLAAIVVSGCATAKLVGERAFTPADPGVARTVVIEPLFELADWQTSTKTEYAQMQPYGSSFGGFGSSSLPTTVAVSRQVQEKPLFARPPVLAAVHQQLIAEVQRRRPAWRVTSTAGAPVLTGNVVVVRSIVEGNQTQATDRTLKNLALGFGFVIWPLQLVHIDPVHETERVYGSLERYALPAEALRQRLVKYPTQPDYAVNLSGISPLRHAFGLDVSYDEGILANELPRTQVLIDGFVDRLASAIIAITEERP
jgi:hypothetical protein